jgi:AbrB family looped-hinge helix DNA binding protein
MNQSATITSKMQFTIPMSIARRVGIHSGERVDVAEEDGKIIITPMKQLIRELAGSISVPEHLKGRDIDELIEEAKEEYFKSKYASKKL